MEENFNMINLFNFGENMDNFDIVKSFFNGTLKFYNFKSSDNLHISFDVELTTALFQISYRFNELIYLQLPFYKKENKLEFFDECCQKCRLNVNGDYIELKIETDNVSSVNKISLNQFEDKEVLNDFFIEFNAVTQTVIFDK